MSTNVSESSRRLARKLRLRYVQDLHHGIQRRRRGNGFEYRSETGRVIRDRKVQRRITSLVIPPAWTNVRICRYENGHLQATGQDARGRKQYLYHPRWTAARSADKFSRLIAFGKQLPRIRRRVARDLARKDLSRERVLGAVVRLLDTSLIRVGNREYALHNKSYGITTLRNQHVQVQGDAIQFQFNGKSGKRHRLELSDEMLAQVVRRCKNMPGKEVFEYIDATGNHRDVTAQEVNAYLQEITGERFTAKDFRTWAGTVMAIELLLRAEHAASETAAKKQIATTVREISEKLGNTAAVCRSSYIHPAVLEAYRTNALGQTSHTRKRVFRRPSGLRRAEVQAIRCLQRLQAGNR